MILPLLRHMGQIKSIPHLVQFWNSKTTRTYVVNEWKTMKSSVILFTHYSAIRMGAIASQITSLRIVYSTVYSGANQRKRQSSASLAFVRGIHWWPMNFPHKGPVTGKMFSFNDIIMSNKKGFDKWIKKDLTNDAKHQFTTAEHQCCELFF